MCHTAAAVAALRAVSHAVITLLMGEEITVLVAHTASIMYLKAYSKVCGWTVSDKYSKDCLLQVVWLVLLLPVFN